MLRQQAVFSDGSWLLGDTYRGSVSGKLSKVLNIELFVGLNRPSLSSVSALAEKQSVCRQLKDGSHIPRIFQGSKGKLW